MLYTHYVFVSSSYTTGQRIAFDTVNDFLAAIYLKEIKEKCGGDINIAVHSFHSDIFDSSAVKQYDSYFDDVEIISDIDVFIKLINKSRVLRGLDIAKFILSKIDCTHLKLQKLTYLCYADYLCKFHEKLFDDDIYAFDYGPVVSSVYNKFKGCYAIDTEEIKGDPELREAINSRIRFADNGTHKLKSINETLNKYGEMSAPELVDLTHSAGSPWETVYVQNINYIPITDEIIETQHKFET